MNNTLQSEISSASPITPTGESPSKNPEKETNKYITFKISDYLFALPSEDILKVVATPPASQGGMVSMGLVQLEQYSIQILNLPTLLSIKEKSTTEPGDVAEELTEAGSVKNPPFLIVMQNADQELCGIAVDAPPDLMDIPVYALKPVPHEKRLTRTLRWVSDVVTYDLGGERHTLLILDISVLLAPKQADANIDSSSFLTIEPPIDVENSKARQEEMYA